MPRTTVTRGNISRWLAAAIVTAAIVVPLLTPLMAHAQVVVVANGSPITELDVQQRSKLLATASQKAPKREEVIQELIDDRLKIAKARVYGLEATNEEVDTAFNNMAQRQKITPLQFAAVLDRSGITAGGLKARLRAQLTWSQLVRGKYNSSLQVGDNDIAEALRARNQADNVSVGYLYTLYPVMVLVEKGSGDSSIKAKQQEAESLRSRFTTCNEGLAMARASRGVAVRDPVNRSSADLPPELRDILGNMQVGHLTAPEVTAQGLQMFALCNKKESTAESSVKRQLREEIYNQRYEAESKRFLDEIRKQAMIEYKK
jgi:peptidyl-prolyl cis-trans isomerase SurA